MKRITYLMALIIAFSSCQEEGEPLTIDTINSLNGGSSKRFEARINGQKFETDLSEGLVYNEQLTITSVNENKSVTVSTSGIAEGIYLGINNSGKNVVNYLDASGTLFSSTKPGVDSDVMIEITKYDEQKKVVSGKVSGTLHAPWEETVDIVNGKFSNVLVEIPFTGEMTADAGSLEYKSSTCIFSSVTSSGFTIETIASSAKNDTLSISFTIEENLTVKTYNLSSDPLTARYNSNVFSTDVFKNSYTGTAGTLKITSIDTAEKSVKGTFDFEAENFLNEKIQINNGIFHAAIR